MIKRSTTLTVKNKSVLRAAEKDTGYSFEKIRVRVTIEYSVHPADGLLEPEALKIVQALHITSEKEPTLSRLFFFTNPTLRILFRKANAWIRRAPLQASF